MGCDFYTCGDQACNGYGEIEDGHGNSWPLCKPGCQLEVVRPGKVQCECERQ